MLCIFSAKADVGNCDLYKDTDFLESFIKYSESEYINLPAGNYCLNHPIRIKNNITVKGNGTVIVPLFDDRYSAAILLEDVKNVKLENIKIMGRGKFIDSPQVTESNSCGFNLKTNGIQITKSNNIWINNIVIAGVYSGIIIMGESAQSLVRNVYIESNTIFDVGRSGITIAFAEKINVNSNTVEHVLGNNTNCQAGWRSSAKFADGIYLDSVRNVTVANNNISDVKRIGIVVEGRTNESKNLVMSNDNIYIGNNFITNVNDCRGTENNAGIWIEPWLCVSDNKITSNKTINAVIEKNVINNEGAQGCHLFQYGILAGANENIIRDNVINGFLSDSMGRGIGIRCALGHCTIAKNKIIQNDIAFMFNDNKKISNVDLDDNFVESNTRYIIMKRCSYTK